jgi:D-alanyl-D-alanine carboxypeptidase/D-alanyl-D-alanine-endopeptidase (penicillin-binding protein 4)
MVATSNKHLTSVLALLLMQLLVFLGVLSFGASASRAATPSPTLVKALTQKVGAHSGAYVYDVTGGSLIAAKNAGVKRILASNTKLFTASAALDHYGADGRISTGIWTDGTIAGGVLTGNLYLRGAGDPLFGSTDFVKKFFGSNSTVEQLALNVRSTGLTQVTGRVYGDETAFDAKRGTAPYGYARSWEIGGQLSGLVFNKGLNGGHFQDNPPLFAAQQMRLALKAAGVSVGSGNGVKPTPPGSKQVAFVDSLPISQIVRQMDKPSNNYLAEMLVKDLSLPAGSSDGGGATIPGSTGSATTAQGAAVARHFANGLGARVSLTDGSGLSRSDLAAPREVVDLLRGMIRKSIFEPFNLSLPIPGVDGTLADRMKGTQASKSCHAKTGTLSNVSAISGICTTLGGHQVAFSILQNQVVPAAAHVTQDKIVTTIARLP